MSNKAANLLVLWIMWATPPVARAFDILYLKESGAALKCRVDALGDDFIKATILLERPGASAATVSRSYRLSEIDYIDFESPEAEVDALNRPKGSSAKILELWNARRRWLPVRKSNTGEIGLALGELLLDSGDPAKVKVALETFRLVEQSDWNEPRRARARQGRLRSMLALGQGEKALAEAKIIAREAENPEIMIEARFVMARATRQEFEALLEENPKWREDDEVRHEVDTLFNTTIDQFLYASLSFGSYEKEAARGLWNAAEVYILAEEPEAARACAADIAALYPETEFAARARTLVAAKSGAPPTGESP